MAGSSTTRYSAELRERAGRMVAEVRADHDSEWAAMGRVTKLLGIGTAETVRKWCRQAEVDGVHYTWQTVWRWLRRKHRRSTWRRSATVTAVADGGQPVVTRNCSTPRVGTTRYRYRDSIIPSPWPITEDNSHAA